MIPAQYYQIYNIKRKKIIDMTDRTMETTETRESRIYRRRWWTLVAISLSILVITLDATVMNVALPTIQRELNANNSELLWMVNAYMMIFGALMLTTGALADRLGRAKLLQAGVVVFGLSSVGAYLSGTATHLIIWRIFMGAGAAMILPATLAIITNIFPEEERGKAIGVWAGLNAVGIALGPIIGGALVQNFNWNSIFLINIPVAVIALILGWFLIPDSRDSNPRKLDIVGNILSLGGLSALIYGLINGSSRGWTDTQVLATLFGSVVLIALFVLWERRVSQPLLEISFFRNARFSAGIGVLIILGLGLNGFQYVLTYYMQFVKGYNALETGLRYLPLALGILVGAVMADNAVKRLGTKWVMAIGFIGTAILFILVSRFTTDSPFWQLGTELFFSAFFLGNIIAPVTDAIMGALPKAKAGIGSAMNTVFRMVSGTIGVAALGAALSSVYASNFLKSVASIPGLPAALVKKASDSVGVAIGIANSGQLSPALASALSQTAKQSFMDGWQTIAIISCAIFVVGAIIVLKFMPARHEPAPQE
jgi:EmrB/QacA subfamily drug resistance transporter